MGCGVGCGVGWGWGGASSRSEVKVERAYIIVRASFVPDLRKRASPAVRDIRKGGLAFQILYHLLVSCPCAAVQCDAACSPRVPRDPRHVGATDMYQGSRNKCTPEREAPKREVLIVGSALDAQRHTVPASAGAWEAFSWVVQNIADIL